MRYSADVLHLLNGRWWWADGGCWPVEEAVRRCGWQGGHRTRYGALMAARRRDAQTMRSIQFVRDKVRMAMPEVCRNAQWRRIRDEGRGGLRR